MFEMLEAAVEEVVIPPDGDAIAAALRLMDKLAAKVADAVAAFDDACGWRGDGAASCTEWLREHGGTTRRSAGRTVRTARALRAMPGVASAWRSGGLSGGQVQAILANVDERTSALFAEQEDELVPWLAPLSVADTAAAMRGWQARASALVDDAALPVPHPNAVFLSRTLDGRRELTGSLDAHMGALVATALRVAETNDCEGESRTPAQRRADALGDVCRFFLDHQHKHVGGRHRPHLNVVVTADELSSGRAAGRLPDGTFLPPAATRALACDAAVHRVVTDGRSAVLDYGHATRTAPAALFAALVVRDGHCRHPGCDRPPEWCDAHHVDPWEGGGATSIENMVLKCRRHHVLGHQDGWTERMDPDGTLYVTAPDGRSWTTTPQPAAAAPEAA